MDWDRWGNPISGTVQDVITQQQAQAAKQGGGEGARDALFSQTEGHGNELRQTQMLPSQQYGGMMGEALKRRAQKQYGSDLNSMKRNALVYGYQKDLQDKETSRQYGQKLDIIAKQRQNAIRQRENEEQRMRSQLLGSILGGVGGMAGFAIGAATGGGPGAAQQGQSMGQNQGAMAGTAIGG